MGQTHRHTDGLNTLLKEYFTTHRPVCNWLLEGAETMTVLLPVSSHRHNAIHKKTLKTQIPQID